MQTFESFFHDRGAVSQIFVRITKFPLVAYYFCFIVVIVTPTKIEFAKKCPTIVINNSTGSTNCHRKTSVNNEDEKRISSDDLLKLEASKFF